MITAGLVGAVGAAGLWGVNKAYHYWQERERKNAFPADYDNIVKVFKQMEALDAKFEECSKKTGSLDSEYARLQRCFDVLGVEQDSLMYQREVLAKLQGAFVDKAPQEKEPEV